MLLNDFIIILVDSIMLSYMFIKYFDLIFPRYPLLSQPYQAPFCLHVFCCVHDLQVLLELFTAFGREGFFVLLFVVIVLQDQVCISETYSTE